MINTSDLAKEVRALAKENPEQVAHCTYFSEHDGSPSCIVGHALSKFGVTLDDLGALNSETGVWSLIGMSNLLSDDGCVDWLNTVQGAQDNGEPWGVAVWLADEELDVYA